MRVNQLRLLGCFVALRWMGFALWGFALLSTGSMTAARAETWYVRADGGTRYTAHATSGQCDGKADDAYPGKGTNRHCAFNDWRFLYDDQGTYGKLSWVLAGGDTVIVDNTKPWRVGWEEDGTHHNERWCWGWEGGPYGCTNPPIPAGTAQHHTRILGRNFEHCSVGGQPNKSKMSQVFGGHAVGAALNLSGAQFLDVQCLEITEHSSCARHGEPRLPSNCRTDPPIDDYDSSGITTDTKTHDLLLQDLWIHGHTDRGIIGPIGGAVTANRVDIAYNGMAGWDFDDGRGTPSVNASLRLLHSTVEWSGCNQEYPATHPNPASSCYGQSDGGYGDGIGTPAGTGMDVTIDHSVFRYNVQDGEDFGHVDSGAFKLSITNSLSYGNGGAQFKWGANFVNVLFANNIALGNCMRMSKPIAGTPATFDAHLHDFCRAQDALSFDLHQGGTAILDNNTIVSYSPTTFDISCWDTSCSNSTILFRNNIVLGIDNSGTFELGGKPGGPGGFYFQKPIGHVIRANNVFHGLRNVRCQANEVCADPKFVNEPRFRQEADLDGFNFEPSADSPARRAGMHLPNLKTDFDGKPRPPSGTYTVGAME